MLDMVLNFVREQGVFVILGLMVAGGIFSQILASARFRKLRRGIQSLAALQTPVKQETSPVALRARTEREVRTMERDREEHRSREEQRVRAEQFGQADSRERAARYESVSESAAENEGLAASAVPASDCVPDAEVSDAQEVDSQLMYLKQSLDRIAAGRDQKYDEDAPKRRKLTPAEEQIIVDILKEYLS